MLARTHTTQIQDASGHLIDTNIGGGGASGAVSVKDGGASHWREGSCEGGGVVYSNKVDVATGDGISFA